MVYTIKLENEKRINHIQLPTIKLARKVSVCLYLKELYLLQCYKNDDIDVDFKSNIILYNQEGIVFTIKGNKLENPVIQSTIMKLNKFLKDVNIDTSLPMNMNRSTMYAYWNTFQSKWSMSNKEYNELLEVMVN